MARIQPTYLSIEGNIGSGKSTLLAKLKNAFKNNSKIVFLKEPVDEWEAIQDEKGNTMLEKFYGNQKKYSFSFQMMAYISRLATFKKAVKENPNATIFISERSLETDKYVFAQMLFDDKKIEDVNYQIYKKWFDTFAQDFPISGIIYVKTTPEICHQRITKRSRDGEGNIPLDYLINCSRYHDSMMSIISIMSKSPVIELNGNVDIYKNAEILQNWVDDIKSFIYCVEDMSQIDTEKLSRLNNLFST
jgi:deoxyadenosine/deoxycytidine kinase